MATALREIGIADRVAAEVVAVVYRRPVTRRPRVTATIAASLAQHLIAGTIDPEAFFQRVWGMSIASYFDGISDAHKRPTIPWAPFTHLPLQPRAS
jgi:hypothetical protein